MRAPTTPTTAHTAHMYTLVSFSLSLVFYV